MKYTSVSCLLLAWLWRSTRLCVNDDALGVQQRSGLSGIGK
jgi:hypothetical protein